MTPKDLKKEVAKVVLNYIQDRIIIGVGTGSTVNYFIDQLASIKARIEACVASSLATEKSLRALGLPIVDLNYCQELPLYIDSADEVNKQRQMIKGGGGALTKEKIIASAAAEFIVIVDESKLVKRLGTFPLAVEVLPMARSFVARELVKMGGAPVYRQGVETDNGNIILDVHNLEINSPMTLETQIKMIPGVVESGLFAKRTADQVLIATQNEVIKL